ncbi:hypothetical protein AHAS_Ahas01G0169700 [Arachis hypogaea]
MVGFDLYTWWNLAYFNQTFCVGSVCTCMVRRSFFVLYFRCFIYFWLYCFLSTILSILYIL